MVPVNLFAVGLARHYWRVAKRASQRFLVSAREIGIDWALFCCGYLFATPTNSCFCASFLWVICIFWLTNTQCIPADLFFPLSLLGSSISTALILSLSFSSTYERKLCPSCGSFSLHRKSYEVVGINYRFGSCAMCAALRIGNMGANLCNRSAQK